MLIYLFLFSPPPCCSLLVSLADFQELGCTYITLHQKSVGKDSEESMSGVTFDPWIPFRFVHTAQARCCELLLCSGTSSAIGIPRTRRNVEDEVSGRAARQALPLPQPPWLPPDAGLVPCWLLWVRSHLQEQHLPGP